MNTRLLIQNYLKLSFTVAFVITLMGSCKKKENVGPHSARLNYTVNNTAKSTTGDGNVYATLNTESNILILDSKLTATSETVTFSIPDFNGTGDYTIPAKASAEYVNGIVPAMNKYVATSGSVTITEFGDDKVAGNFRFYSLNANENYKDITNGSFVAKVKKN